MTKIQKALMEAAPVAGFGCRLKDDSLIFNLPASEQYFRVSFSVSPSGNHYYWIEQYPAYSNKAMPSKKDRVAGNQSDLTGQKKLETWLAQIMPQFDFRLN